MRACLYARYSTEKQSADSIEDQHRTCERLAERHGLTVTARFSDAAISGGTAQRPGYQALLGAARRREFDVIIAEDTSRLWRNLAEQAPRLAELADLGIHVVTHDLDTRTESAGMLGAVLGASSEAYRKEIGRRTRRGLEGRARQGKTAGGHSYGYIAARESADGQIEINQEEAEVIRRIYQQYADGKSPRAIADELNRNQVPAPGASWARAERRQKGWVASALHGDGKASGILHNPLYRGEIIWNRVRWVRSAANSHKRRRVENPRSEWIVRAEPRLRIVPQALWERVRARQRERSHEVGERISRGMARLSANHMGRSPRYLLSGLLKCSQCGASYQINGAKHYACSGYLNGGPNCCPNNARLHRDKAEAGVLEGIQRIFLAPAVIEEGQRRARALIKARATKPSPDTGVKRSRSLKEEIANLADAIAQGVLRSSPAIAEKLRAAEEELARLEAQPARPVADIERLIPRLAEEIRSGIEALPKTLADGNVDLARQELKGYLGSIRVVAEPARMLLYSERNLAEAVIARIAGGNVASINGSGGRI
jgi:site-specific DNA recombinase